MLYFGIEIFDGKPLKEINLDDNLSLEKQWFHLTQDITCINYVIHERLHFSVDVSWLPGATVTPNSYFLVKIIEGPYTDGAIFFEKKSKSIEQMKIDLQEAVHLIQSFKKMTVADILIKKMSG